MDQISSIIHTNMRYNICSIYKTFELSMLIHLNSSTNIFIYIYIYKSFHTGYQITNSTHLSETLQIGG